MKVSVFTPSNNRRWLTECYESLLSQSHTDWEWVILLNGGAQNVDIEDPRVKIRVAQSETRGIGALKAETVSYCSGDILLELDHDDTLSSSALEEVVKAFEANPEAGMVYSQCANIDAEGNPYFQPFGEGYGWRYKQAHGKYAYPQAMAHTPHNVALIWFAPNHLRSFTRAMYDKVGGYDCSLDILDDQDLMCRLYQVGDFVLIDKLLYYQRVHDSNAQGSPNQPQTEMNARIQVETWDLYERHIQANALAWANRQGLRCLDLGGVHNKPEGYEGVDQHPGADIQHTFPAALNLPDNSVGVIRAMDFLEHVEDKVAMMNEIYRLLAPGGMLFSMTPSSEGWGADQDPTHVAKWNPNSFWYFSNPEYAKFIPEITAQFQESRITHGYPSLWHEANRIPYVTANLIAVKAGMKRCGGSLFWEDPNRKV